ncbi:MAG TPA: sulfatase [Chthoniobacteraceae bacterium]|jgi:arylsulfatase A-like enzyme|nr:sulfatase [Chthoniobacteraceae bacterium]
MNRLLLVALTLAFAVSARAEPKKPNVLFIAVDDLRDWVGYLGKNAQTITPNIDRLAARGVAFTHAYCAAPVCNPSRTALMSGMRPSTTGVYSNSEDWRPAIPEALTLTAAFRKAGWYVCGAGKIYHEAYTRPSDWDDYLVDRTRDPLPEGNDGVDGIKFAPVQARDEDLRDWHTVQYGIEEFAKPHDKPLFLAVGLKKPHMPWNVPQKYYDLHPLDKIVLPPTLANDLDDVPPAGVKMAKPQGDHAAIVKSGRWKDAVQGYLAAISYSDAMIGRLLDAFDKYAERDNTIVVLWSDHGWHLGEKEHWRKFALWEEATRSPTIWVVPGLTKPGRCERTVDHMSIFPTLVDLCGIPKPAHVEGQSIRALLADPNAKWEQPALTTYLFQNHAVRTEAWRYIRYANGDEELYDEKNDPFEWKNLARTPETAAITAELAKTFPTKNHPALAASLGKNGKPEAEEK